MKEPSPPVSAMATPTNSSGGNVVDDFEEAFQHCLNVLTKDEACPASEKDERLMEIDQTTLRFVDLARQMEAFFLQKRFLLSALKPEMVVKEDITELRMELARKEDLLKRHYERINTWQTLLMDLQGYAKSPGTQVGGAPGNPSAGGPPPGIGPGGLMAGAGGAGIVPGQLGPSSLPPNVGGSNPMSGGSMSMQQQLHQQQLQQQQMQHLQQQQQHMQQQMQVPSAMSGGGVMVPTQQALFMQQQQARGPPFGPQQTAGGVLQGPLAYLEKTTSNIDLVAGMTDGRR